MNHLATYIQSYFNIPSSDIEKIQSFFKPESIKKGDYFLKAGRQCSRLSFLQEGLLRVYTTTATKDVTQWISSKGYMITDLSGLIFQLPSTCNIQALTDCELYSIEREDYNDIGKVIPQWHYLEKLFIAKCFKTLEDRVFTHLAMTAEERYQQFFNWQPELFNQVPLQYIASMLGMTAETLSRLRNKKLNS
ncbi:CRP-like cAMP-binding protein [Chitinophaga niastensis]|uniref:CRP-like cAMP-binding protein n=1 Tax=Chitinophaga niastensis TaxID=536980 RepID=A0A2P8HTF3_CHINA|nr:Crp/Fnr family transcriptional regulator [Chitinophaga niastensis]PSL49506.1 CRP-like cAMP-binding protein [Chitinophaga niastensis]